MKKTLGGKIASLRKEKSMTQLELAEKLGVTDKAISKWERDLCCPDIATLPKLAEVLGIRVDALMQADTEPKEETKMEFAPMLPMIMKAVALAMGVSVAVLSALGELDGTSGMGMLGIGLTCLAVVSLGEKA